MREYASTRARKRASTRTHTRASSLLSSTRWRSVTLARSFWPHALRNGNEAIFLYRLAEDLERRIVEEFLYRRLHLNESIVQCTGLADTADATTERAIGRAILALEEFIG